MHLLVKDTAQCGRGVFAGQDIAEGELVERCEVIYLSEHDRKIIDGTTLFDYYFAWGKSFTEAAIALGFGSLYNHSFSPNVIYTKQVDENCIDFIALRSIFYGEELTVNYNGDPENNAKVWFNDLS